MSCCHNCQKRKLLCETTCTERATEKLLNDLRKREIYKAKTTALDATGVTIARWEHNHRRKSRQM